MVHAGALAEATSDIELIGAIKPLLFNPLVFAKVAANISDISAGRLSINVVSGWFLPELEALGIDPLHHDDRYAYTREWLDIVTDLWSGKHVSIGAETASRRSSGLSRNTFQRFMWVGESEPGRALAVSARRRFSSSTADRWPIPRPLSTTHPPRDRQGLRFGLSAFVIARPPRREARAEEAYLQSLIDAEHRPEISPGTDPNTAMYQVLAGTSRIGSNGGTLAGLVGSYEQVIERIDAFHAAGIDLFMLQFQPIEAELDRFAENIIGHYR